MRISSATLLVGLASLFFTKPTLANSRYGESLCEKDGYYCLKIKAETKEVTVKNGDKSKKVKRRIYIAENILTGETREFESLPTWDTLWPEAAERNIVQKVNRLNISIRNGFVIAVPNDMQDKTYMNFSPFPQSTEPNNEKLLIWDPKLLAWAAYDSNGVLIAWGPGVGGMDFCPDIKRSCRTIAGTFTILEKYGANYRSSKYPLDECRGSEPGRPGCAPMPYFMKFHRGGLGFHGSPDVPGAHASHGCVRIFTEDAEWLSKNFADTGTKTVIRAY